MPFADINGTRIHYTEGGDDPPRAGEADHARARDKPLLLLLHGFTLDSRMWSRQLGALPALLDHRVRVVAYDSRGFGRSAMPELGVTYKHCEDAAALAEHLGAKQVVIVGHSIGAHHLLELAATRPDLVVGAITVCMSGLASIPFPPEIQAVFAGIRKALSDGQSVKAAKDIWASCGWFDSVRAMPDLMKELEAIAADYTGWQWTNANPVENIAPPPLAERLGDLKIPALVITGDKDIPYNDVIGDALCKGIPGATRLRLANAGHMANMEAPAEVNEAIASFVRMRLSFAV